MGKTVTYTPPPKPPISAEERKRLLAVSKQNEENVDASDAPPLSEAELQRAVRGRFYRPTKTQVTLRIDAGVIDWFKRNTPQGYQTDINRVLADYVAAQEKKAG